MTDITEFEGSFLGVLGGMGPMAGAFFMERLTALSKADHDQDHMPAVLWSDPRVPGRTKGYSGIGEDPLPWMQNGVNQLVRIGAQAIAIPCNTAHLWFDELVAATPVPIFHIVRAVIDDLRRQGNVQARVGLMGTATTLKLNLYQRELEANGYDWVIPSEEYIQDKCNESIRLVAANRIEEAFSPAAECIAHLKSRGADVVVLGCTELPLAVPHRRRADMALPIADSIDALARAAINWYSKKEQACIQQGI